MNIKVEIFESDESVILTLYRDKSEQEVVNSRFVWSGDVSGNWLNIYETETGSVYKIEKDPNISTPDDEIISQFNDQKAEIAEIESSGIEYNGEETEEEPFPYDPDLIRVDPRPYQVNLVNELIEEGDIDLSPDFQRHFVWKEITQRSRLIESMMLRIPLPVFYMAQDSEGKFQVVDGLQRLTVINQYLKNEFKLKGLEYLKDCEGKYYKKTGDQNNNIDPKYARRIAQTQLIFNIIDPQTPFRVKFDIFRRINQGGKPLKAQEIRNCMASRKTRNLLKKLANSEEFKTATGNSINPTRMEDQELVLRFIGFYYSQYINKESLKYSGNMNDFLDNVIDILNKMMVYKSISNRFYYAMENAAYLFGPYAFRKCKKEHLRPGARKQFINKSLFTTWSVLLSRYNPDDVKNKVKPEHLTIPLASEIDNNTEYFNAITSGTNDISRINTSFRIAGEILGKYLL